MTLNVHNMIHWPTMVERWGPAWGCSNFNPESLNGWIKRQVYGKGSMITKAAMRFIQAKEVSKETLKLCDSKLRSYCLTQLQIP